MTLQEAIQVVRLADIAMKKDYKREVFDEYAIVGSVGRETHLFWYEGPRKPEFVKKFNEETAALRAESRSRFTNRYEIGDFEFTPDGVGSQSEAFLVLGAGVFLICGNTQLSMAEIAKDRLWLAAQKHFVDLSDRFRLDPLIIPVPPSGAATSAIQPTA
jgi:hypothetical protein